MLTESANTMTHRLRTVVWMMMRNVCVWLV